MPLPITWRANSSTDTLSSKIKVLAIVGPTASGKSALAMQVAAEKGAEIVSVDSACVYRGMDIGTVKPSLQDRRSVPHHMIDIANPGETLTVAQFQAAAREACRDIASRSRGPLLVGGSGLYYRAVIDPLEFPGTDRAVRMRIAAEGSAVGAAALHKRLARLDPQAADRIHEANLRRTVRALEVLEVTGRPFSSFRTAWESHESIYELAAAGLLVERSELDRRIDKRVDDLIAQGLAEEVSKLVAAGFRSSVTSVQALGYAQILDYLDGLVTLDEAVIATKRATRSFARRQMTWFKADPRIRWFESQKDAAQYLMEA